MKPAGRELEKPWRDRDPGWGNSDSLASGQGVLGANNA
jgi:hypothetical protein